MRSEQLSASVSFDYPNPTQITRSKATSVVVIKETPPFETCFIDTHADKKYRL